jgi:type I site-specific restriction endonuclease
LVIRNFPLKSGYGFADYIFYVDGKAAGVIEAKKAGNTLTGVEIQADKYKHGLPDGLPAWHRPLPFCYQSTGIETRFTNGLEPDSRSRSVFSFHRPETISDWVNNVKPNALDRAAEEQAVYGAPSTLLSRLRNMPPLKEEGLWPAQIKAIKNLEKSLAENRPRALIQMATGSGKTFTAVTAIYIDKRDRETRALRWERLDEDLEYAPEQLDRDVVSVDQIRTVIQTFCDKLFTEIFPGRKDVPKTLIYAKDDSHAEDIVKIVREEFGKGNEFCQK